MMNHQRNKEEKRKQGFMGNSAKPIYNNEEDIALEQMNLDKKEDFEGDAFDPFSVGQT